MGARKYSGEVRSYNFSSFSDEAVKGENYNFQNFELNTLDAAIIAKEHGNALSHGFNIGEEIKKQRGHAQYAEEQYNLKIEEEVQKRIEKLKSDTTKKSYEHAIKMAKTEIESQFLKNFEQQVSDLTNYVAFIKEQQRDILLQSKKDVLKILQLVVQWILQKEVKVDYVEKILPIILNQVQDNQKILIKVDPATFETLQGADNLISQKFTSFKDIKLISDDHIPHPGVMVETDSNIFDATYDAQLKLVEDIFSNISESMRGSSTSES